MGCKDWSEFIIFCEEPPPPWSPFLNKISGYRYITTPPIVIIIIVANATYFQLLFLFSHL